MSSSDASRRSPDVTPTSYRGVYLGGDSSDHQGGVHSPPPIRPKRRTTRATTTTITQLFNPTNQITAAPFHLHHDETENTLFENNNHNDRYPGSNSGSPVLGTHELSDIETAILRANQPIDIDETDEIEVAGSRGIWANKSEVANWRGPTPIENYPVNEDSDPHIITKNTSQMIEYVQEMAVRYLKPPTPEPPGDIVINQLADMPLAPAPPIIIRQQPPRPRTPEPLVFREAPPPMPQPIGRKVITITGKKMPPPPRKVIVERLAPLPEKPRAVLIERWLPYTPVKRKVIFNRAPSNEVEVLKPKNVIIQWEAPRVSVRREIRYLGVVRANPDDYVQRYGDQLKRSDEMPQFINDIKTPEGITLAADVLKGRSSAGGGRSTTVHELHGDVEALRLVDLDREGLSEYRDQLNRLISSKTNNNTNHKSHSHHHQQHHVRTSPNSRLTGIDVTTSSARSPPHAATSFTSSLSPPSLTSSLSPPPAPRTTSHTFSTHETLHHHRGGGGALTAQQRPGVAAPKSPSIYRQLLVQKANEKKKLEQQKKQLLLNEAQLIDEIVNATMRKSTRLSVEEAERSLLRINSRMGRRLGLDDVKLFFSTIDVKSDGTIHVDDFKSALIKLRNSIRLN